MWKTPSLPQHHPKHEHSCLCSLQPVCEWIRSYSQKCYRRDLDYTHFLILLNIARLISKKSFPPQKKMWFVSAHILTSWAWEFSLLKFFANCHRSPSNFYDSDRCARYLISVWVSQIYYWVLQLHTLSMRRFPHSQIASIIFLTFDHFSIR